MSETIKSIVRFSFILLCILLASFGIQAFIEARIGISIFENLLISSYVTNYILVLITFILIVVLKDNKSKSLGFVFLGGFLFKMAIYFIMFSPTYNADGVIDKVEFLAFFTPYAICLTYETYVLVTLLNRA